ncbi:MAG: hypothetical protein WCK53_09930, partial [Methanomicrobiales archaeon]
IGGIGADVGGAVGAGDPWDVGACGGGGSGAGCGVDGSPIGTPQLSQNLLPGSIVSPQFSQNGIVTYHIEYKSKVLYYNSEKCMPCIRLSTGDYRSYCLNGSRQKAQRFFNQALGLSTEERLLY